MDKKPSSKFTQISDLFSVYKQRLKPPQSSVEQVCYEVIKEVTKLPLSRESVVYTVSTRTISIQAPSLVKTELSFHYDEIKKQLQNKLGVGNAPLHIR